MMKVTTVVLLLQFLHCFAQSDGTSFMIYNAHKNRCLGDNLRELFPCNPQSPRQQFRWTSENRIFNVEQKKCLGTGSKSEGNKLQWYICDANNDLQKWECQSDSLFGLKNESLYLSLRGDSHLLTLSKDPGDKGKWTVHGTTDSVCSRPYEEIYTIEGNAFGQPCHFPFLFNDKWYTDCTTEGRSSSLLWCAIESEYKPNQLWGYCPTQEIVQQFWRKNPLTDVYYQLNKESALTWYQARKSCQQQGGDLLSITEPHEQTFISGLTVTTGPVLWTGLNSLDASSGWRWVNGQPLRYLKWLSGEPSAAPGHSCGVITQLYGSEWSTAVCSERHGYICQRGLSTPTVPPVVLTGSCHSPWIPYSGHCYLLTRTKKTWLEARDACRSERGDLLSILSIEEQSFVISQLGYSKTDELWIGFNDLKTALLFEWSDHSGVPFALWDVNEPSHNAALKEDCVLMRGQEGKWADQVCQSKYGYICKKKTHLNTFTNDTVVASPGCKPGWVRFGYYCYLAGSETKTFDAAKQMCEKTGSYLADITNRIENAFLVSLIGARPEKHFWIGLSNRDNRHIFEWTNNKKVPFTHFNAGMPGGKQGCVAMTTGVLAGLWDVLNCTNQEKYICKQKAEGVITTPAPPTTPAVSCSDGWHPITNRDYCFKLFLVRQNEEKTWSEALDFCREIGGDLLSVHSSNDIITPDMGYVPAWIGYSIQDPTVGYTWSDGSSSSYENWEEGEPNNLNDVEKCVTMRFQWWRHGKGQWNDLQCESKADWYCEIRKGVTPKEVEITEKTYNKTEDGWLIFKDNQYYVYEDSFVSMEKGRSFCKHRHGDLVVINDEEERVFLWHQLMRGYADVYIGMTIDLDKSVMWMDGSPVVFQRWAENQPAYLNNEERCVKMTRSQGLWESVNCGDTERFICKRSGSVPVNATAAPTEPPKGGCAPDWVKFQEKCFKVQLEPKPWTEARSYCMDVGGNLASISNPLQQAFLTLKMVDDNTPDLWLGFSNLAVRRFKWTDGSPVTFTNWPKGASEYPSESMCVAMAGRQRAQLGKWEKKDCNDTSIGFICSRALDHLIIPSPTEVPKTFKLENSSYTLIQKNLTWNESQSLCKAEGANLASIRDILTQSYIELQAHKLRQPLWIGLNSMETDGYFMWIDKWQLNMEKWANDEPKKGHPCVYVDVDGMWKTAQCNQTYYGLCKTSTDVAPPPPEQYPGMCPEQTEDGPAMTWLPFRGHCYAFVTSSYSWTRASDICTRRGATLVSIQDQKEAAFIDHYISFIGNLQSNFWIGLYKTYVGHWKWLDNSVVDYTNWEESGGQIEDDDDGHYFFTFEADCALISSRTKQWRKHHCRYNEAMFICKTAKVIIPTVGTNHTEVAETQRTNVVGVSLAAVIVVLSVLAGLAYIYYRTSKRQLVLPSVVNPMYYTTTSPITEEKGMKSLVDHMDE
uniref:Mannose receptor, C type 1b n=1 Tax=Pygocentrus nattereri TaxID=42514 RepID=A0A3B4D8F7_PYGNA